VKIKVEKKFVLALVIKEKTGVKEYFRSFSVLAVDRGQ
jgi:hypothetical protein